jgi:two-component system, cell cycle response regulator DivK
MISSRILIVDGSDANRKLVCAVLASEGYEVESAADAEEASAAIRLTLPDLILVDLTLPGMDGLMFARMLKRDSATRHIVIVALTAFAMKSDEARAFAAGCDGCISKPIDARLLPRMVARFTWRATVDPPALRGASGP